MTPPLLITPRLLIRSFTLQDAPRVQLLAGDPAIADTTLNIPHPYEDGMAEVWIAGHADQFNRGEQAHFAVVLRDADELMGAVGLTFVSAHARAELGYWIGRPYWSRGYCTEAARAVMGYAFMARGINRVQATHLSRNPASGRVMQKLGMRHEGTALQYFRKAGRFEDVERFAVLRDEYFAASETSSS
jgi:RimJ/RimL family protein N-acetyltransferase